jgi:hypothetical protein
MERNSPASQGYKLESQIRESFGRVVYTQTCHDKIIHRLLWRNEVIKIWQIFLSALTTSSFLIMVFSEEKISGIIGALLSLVLLILNTYTKNSNLIEQGQQHQQAADQLWVIREEYVSLLTDFELLNVQEIRQKRDDLLSRTASIYASSPRTDKKSYKETQRALKTEEEQTFSENEIDIMLANSIRRNNRAILDTQESSNAQA